VDELVREAIGALLTCKICRENGNLHFPPHDSLQHFFCAPKSEFEWHCVLSRPLESEEETRVSDAFTKDHSLEAFVAALPEDVSPIAMLRLRGAPEGL
jgi:hypothetical protein